MMVAAANNGSLQQKHACLIFVSQLLEVPYSFTKLQRNAITYTHRLVIIPFINVLIITSPSVLHTLSSPVITSVALYGYTSERMRHDKRSVDRREKKRHSNECLMVSASGLPSSRIRLKDINRTSWSRQERTALICEAQLRQ